MGTPDISNDGARFIVSPTTTRLIMHRESVRGLHNMQNSFHYRRRDGRNTPIGEPAARSPCVIIPHVASLSCPYVATGISRGVTVRERFIGIKDDASGTRTSPREYRSRRRVLGSTKSVTFVEYQVTSVFPRGGADRIIIKAKRVRITTNVEFRDERYLANWRRSGQSEATLIISGARRISP